MENPIEAIKHLEDTVNDLASELKEDRSQKGEK